MTKTKPWKQNLLKIPPRIEAKVKSFKSDDCVVACVMSIGADKIDAGLFRHLEISRVEGQPVFPEQIVPPKQIGRYSRYNIDGREIVRDDLPKEPRTWSIEAPNYGDWSRGSHEVDFSKDAYPREYFAPKLVPITIRYEGEDIQKQKHIFRFTVDQVLNREAANFWDELLFNLNLLQENIGNHDVFESDATLDDYLRTLYVNWEILPPGESEEMINRILAHSGKDEPRVRERVVDRYNFLRSLNPQNYIAGTNEFRRYFGAQFADDLVVFENVEYGNAIYVMFDNWMELSRKSRTELLSSSTSEFVRIRHTKTWKRRLARLIYDEMWKRHHE